MGPARTPGRVPQLKKHKLLPGQPSAIHMGQIPLTSATLEAGAARGSPPTFVDSTGQADADPVNDDEEEEGESDIRQAGITRRDPVERNAAGTAQHSGQATGSNQHTAQGVRYATCKILAFICHTGTCAMISTDVTAH